MCGTATRAVWKVPTRFVSITCFHSWGDCMAISESFRIAPLLTNTSTGPSVSEICSYIAVTASHDATSPVTTTESFSSLSDTARACASELL